MSDQSTHREPEPIACTLAAGDAGQRLNEWRGVLANVVRRDSIEGGVRLTFGPDVSVASVAELAGAERSCCSFFRFAITIDERGVALEVTAPADAADLVTALFD